MLKQCCHNYLVCCESWLEVLNSLESYGDLHVVEDLVRAVVHANHLGLPDEAPVFLAKVQRWLELGAAAKPKREEPECEYNSSKQK